MAASRAARTMIVGAGPTGALAAALLRRAAASPHDLSITIYEKARGPGGRMATTRASGAALGTRADSGAQYLTQFNPRHTKYYTELVSAGVLRPLVGLIKGHKEARKGQKNFTATAGLSSITRHFIDAAGAALKPNKLVQSIELVAEECHAHPPPPPATTLAAVTAAAAVIAGGGARAAEPVVRPRWRVKCDDGSSESVDAVVLTLPVPQILALGGDVPALLEGSGTLAGLKGVKYSNRYALVCYFSPSDWLKMETSVPYVGRYVSAEESDAIRWLSFDSVKRGVAPTAPAAAGVAALGAAVAAETAAAAAAAAAAAKPLPAATPAPATTGAGASSSAAATAAAAAGAALPPPEPCPALVVQSSVDFGRMFLETDPEKVEPILMEHLRRLLPGLPEPVETKCHRWRYSQVTQGYKGPEPFVSEFKLEDPEAPVPEHGDAAATGGAAAASAATSGGAKAGELTKTGIASLAAAASRVGALLIVDNPPLLLAGDAFAESNFEGCATSAEKAASYLVQALQRSHRL